MWQFRQYFIAFPFFELSCKIFVPEKAPDPELKFIGEEEIQPFPCFSRTVILETLVEFLCNLGTAERIHRIKGGLHRVFVDKDYLPSTPRGFPDQLIVSNHAFEINCTIRIRNPFRFRIGSRTDQITRNGRFKFEIALHDVLLCLQFCSVQSGIFLQHFIYKPALPGSTERVITQTDRHISFFCLLQEPLQKFPPLGTEKCRLAGIG